MSEIRNFSIDIVFCLDLTLYAKHLLDQFKNNCLSMFEEIGKYFENKERAIGEFRARIIGFRDFIENQAIIETDFFEIPRQTEKFMQVVNSLEASGGGDIDENGLEAVALALKSSWTENKGLKRHVIFVITDAPALDLDARADYPNYPAGMPKDMQELTQWYTECIGSLSESSRRFILLSPEGHNWIDIAETWEYCYHIPVSSDSDIEAILKNSGEMIYY